MNHRGDTVATYNTGGSLTCQIWYDAFGNIVQSTPSADLPFYTFSTKEYLADVALYLYQYRVYDPVAGRWTQRDPIDYQDSENLYQFCGNNPVNGWDVDGLLTVHIWRYQGKNTAWGHASITLENGTHISWWPNTDTAKGLGNVYTADAYENQTFARDVEYEGKSPDVNIKIENLDEEAIEKWWNDFKKENKWKTLSQNCSTTAADALKAGGAYNELEVTWTPADVERYANEINRRRKTEQRTNKKMEYSE